jgi:hypothetical protein
LYSNYLDGDAHYVAANNPMGTSWSLPIKLLIDGSPLPDGNGAKFIDVAGGPAYLRVQSEEVGVGQAERINRIYYNSYY